MIRRGGVITVRIGWQRALRAMAMVALIGPTLAACGMSGLGATVQRDAFTSKEFGVKASPRVSNSANPRKGGGRYLVGKPYLVHGTWYTPAENPNYVATGSASWYGSDFHGRLTANGEIFSANAITGAHPTLPLPCYVRVTNLDNGASLVVRVNDRGPYIAGRIVDVSYRAAAMLGFVNNGSAHVQVNYVGPAQLSGDDTRSLLRTYQRPTEMGGPTYVASADRDPVSLADIAGNLLGLGYVEGTAADGAGGPVVDASDAAAAMAMDSAALDQQPPDAAAGTIRLELGSFVDADEAFGIAEQFAMLGAVDQEAVSGPGVLATRLTLTHLKPGVGREDVAEMARALGLTGLVVY